MTETAKIRYVPFAPHHADELVVMWRRSFERAVGVNDPHPLEEQKRYLLNVVVPNNDVWVALAGDQIVGFIAASDESIDQLYVHTAFQGQGIGSQLLQWAKDRSTGRLWLYTFESNRGAQRFYEARGFRIAARGFEENWGLEDIRYEWERPEQRERS